MAGGNLKGGDMPIYGINLNIDNETFTMDAECFEISEGFVRLYKDINGLLEEFASYSASTVNHIVLQDKFGEENK